MSKIAWNRKKISRQEYVEIRRLFFQNFSLSEISKKTSKTVSVLQGIRDRNNFIKKRERYFRMVCFFSYKNKIHLNEACRKLGIRKSSLMKFKRKNKIKTQNFNPWNKIITKEMELKFIEDYGKNINSNTIAKKYGLKSGKSVLDVLKKNKIKRKPAKKYTEYNVDYFKKIDNHRKAYIIGFLCTDGYVLKDYNGVGIQLIHSDKYILELMSQELGKSCTFVKTKSSKISLGAKYNRSEGARLLCHCPEISKDLKKHEIVKNKTKLLEFDTKIPKKFLSSYFRGIIDGDGTIGLTSDTKYPWISISTASPSFAEGLVKKAPSWAKLKSYRAEKDGSVFYNVRVMEGKSAARKFLKWIYKSKENFFLERKYELVKDFINQ